MKGDIRAWLSIAALGSAFTGTALLVVNVAGLAIPLRAQDVTGYADFAGAETLDYETALRRLDDLGTLALRPERFVTDATRLFHDGIAHVASEDIRRNGLSYYGMWVPITENWILYALGYFKPDTYRDYEFCSYKRALERGTGRCGQQSMALVGFLADHGYETGFVALEGHAIATAKVDESRWFLLDPDYGAVIPYGIDQAERDPAAVLKYYWSDAARENRIHELYAPDNRVKYGGPEARYARACPLERIAYLAKWVIPLLMLCALFYVARPTRGLPRR